MIVDKEATSRGGRIKLLAAENRRRRERTLLSDKVRKFTGLPFAEDEFSVSASKGEIYYSAVGIGGIAEFEIDLPENYLEANRRLFAEFGSMVHEQVFVSIRLNDIWLLSLESEIAFSHIVEFCELGGYGFTASNFENGMELNLHKYFHFVENRWDCYHKFWKLIVVGERWCKFAKQLFVIDAEV